jgi:hypothetical protein
VEQREFNEKREAFLRRNNDLLKAGKINQRDWNYAFTEFEREYPKEFQEFRERGPARAKALADSPSLIPDKVIGGE